MLEAVLGAARWVHIGAGALGLFVFWVPVLSRKGGGAHKRFGRLFKWSAYVSVGAAGAIVLFRWLEATAMGVTPRDDVDSYGFLVFLGYLALVTLVIVRHGVSVLEHKADLGRMNRPADRTLAWASIAASLSLAAFAIYYQPAMRWALIGLSPVGIIVGRGILDAVSGRLEREGKGNWLTEHLGAMLGAGIAYHTAFGVFGSAQIFDLPAGSGLSIAPWILPTLVGVPASILLTRKYTRPKSTAEAS